MENTGIEIPSPPDTAKGESRGCLTPFSAWHLTITSHRSTRSSTRGANGQESERTTLQVRGKCVGTESPETLPVGRGRPGGAFRLL